MEAGLINPDVAAAIETYESGRSETSRIGRGMEAIAFLGAVLILIELGVLAAEFWDRLVPWGRFALDSISSLWSCSSLDLSSGGPMSPPSNVPRRLPGF